MFGELLPIGLKPEACLSATLRQNLIVAAVNTEKLPNRAAARQLVRDALCQLLARPLGTRHKSRRPDWHRPAANH